MRRERKYFQSFRVHDDVDDDKAVKELQAAAEVDRINILIHGE